MLGCGRPGPGGHIYRTFAWMFWLSCLAEVILFLQSGHTERQRERHRERERGGGGGGRVRDWTELTAGVNFAFSSMPNDMHAEERQARLERELKYMSRQRRVWKRTVAYRPAVSIRLSRSLGFPTCLFLVSLLSGPHERRPMASRKEQLSSSFFVAWTTQTLHENLSMGFRRAKFTQRNTNLQKNIFVDDRLRGHHPRALINGGRGVCWHRMCSHEDHAPVVQGVVATSGSGQKRAATLLSDLPGLPCPLYRRVFSGSVPTIRISNTDCHVRLISLIGSKLNSLKGRTRKALLSTPSKFAAFRAKHKISVSLSLQSRNKKIMKMQNGRKRYRSGKNVTKAWIKIWLKSMERYGTWWVVVGGNQGRIFSKE